MARKMPFVCANPDLVVDVGETRHLCAGSIAAEYERRGGDVFWAGKPHPSAYGTALQVAGELRGSKPRAARVLAVGDAVRTDLAAAQGPGRRRTVHHVRHPQRCDHDRRPRSTPAKIAALFAPQETPPAVAVMSVLRW